MANSTKMHDMGMKYRREVLGDAYVDKSMGGADDFNRGFQEFVTEYCWGGSWGRGILSKRDRSILNLGMLAALNRPHEFKLHFRGAITNGLSVADLREICTQVAIYCGIPAGIEAFRLAREVFNEQGIDISNIDVKTDLED
ncbi:MAG TPA: 4-carboxymuconolactone decarboxylase [Rhodospirillaceae bacterium]|nr:4-carboxymuconolactone decarboxylase [Rhodospirillaceae bacterium]